MPCELGIEGAILTMLEAHDLRSDNTFERVQNRTGAKALEGVAPMKSFTQVDGIVVAIGIPEPHQQPTGDVPAKCIDQLLAQQPHRRRAQNHHALLMQPDDAEIGAKIGVPPTAAARAPGATA